MDDLISRQAMLDGIDKLIKIHFDRTVVLYKARKVAEDLPSVQPETNCSEIPNNWIPCSERQPNVNGWYITTISGEICGQDRAFSGMSEFANGKWTSGDDADETEMTIAWCPLPEPYQGGEQT